MTSRVGRRLAAWVAAAAVAGLWLAAVPVRAADSVTLPVEVSLPRIVGIRISTRSVALRPRRGYPPESFPYWVASESFLIRVFSTTSFKVTVSADDWPAGSGLSVGDLYVAAWQAGSGPSVPPHGSEEPGSGWQKVGDGDDPTTIIGPRPSTFPRWDAYRARILLRLSGDEPESDPTYTTTLTCTISAVS